MRHTLVAVATAALLVLTGCGSTNAAQEVDALKADGEPTVATQDAGQETSFPTRADEACDVLTRKIAKSILGNVGEASAPPPPTRDDDVIVTSCVRANAAASLDSPRSVSLVMRVATSVAGARANESVFESDALPGGATEVADYGQAAFWNPAFGQLNILLDGNWYILASGPIDPRKHTLTETKTLADAIIDRL